jgi:hypothetical protein
MRSVADRLREDTRRRTNAMPADARVQLALSLGDADASALAATRGISVGQARTAIARSRSLGRQPSCADGG